MTIYSYDQELGYKIQIQKRDGSETYYTFDSIAQRDGTPQPINIQNMHLNLNSTMSSLDFLIEDSDKAVDRTKVAPGRQVVFQYGKHNWWSDPASYAFIGYIDYPTPARPATNQNEIKVQCYEVKKGLYDTLVNFARSSPLAELSNPLSQKAKDYTLRAHLRRLLQKAKHTILDDVAIKDRFGLDESGISTNLDVIIPNVVYNYFTAGDMIDDLINKVGAVWLMDYTGGVKKVVADYAVNMHAPILVKNGPAVEGLIAGDDPKRTAYTAEGFEIPSTSASSSGHATRLFGLTKVDRHVVSLSETVTNSTSLTNKAIYQPFTTNEVRFNGLDFTCSKKGDPQSPKNRLNGGIFTNKIVSGVNMPDIQLMKWHVPLDDIESNKTIVHVELDDIRTRFIDENVTFGILWYQRSGVKGDPNTDENNTILIYRDNSSTGGSSIAQGGDRDAKLTWKAHGPQYAYSISSALSRIFAVTNYTAAEDVGFIEPQPLDLDVIDDANLALRYLGNVLYATSLYKGEPRFVVTHPDDFVFKPYQTIRVVDSLSHPTGFELELHEIDIDFSRNTNEIQLGGVVYLDSAWPEGLWPCLQVI